MHCLTCGYNLNQLTENRCPECGRGFDPNDRMTWGNKRAYKFRRCAKISGWLCGVGVALPAVLATGAIAIGLYDVFIVVMLWMYAAIPTAVLLLVWLGSLWLCDDQPGRRALWVGITLVVFNLSLLTQWPIDLAFYLHRPALNQLVERHNAGETISFPVQVGVFRIYDIESIHWHSEDEPIIDLQLSPGTGGPDHLVYGMSDDRFGRAATPFNIFSDKRLDDDWHIVHED